MGCKSLKTVYIPESVRKLGDALFLSTEGITVTFDGAERQWRLMAKPRKEKRDATVRGEWDKAPYYHTDDTAVEKQTVTISPMAGCKSLTVNCKKDGITLKIGF